MKTLLTLLLTAVTVNIVAQAPEIEWAKSLGGSSTDIAKSIIQTNDGGYIVAGYTGSSFGGENHGGYDALVIKLSAAGDLEWRHLFGGTDLDYANRVKQTADGGYVIAGSTSSNDGDITFNHGSSDYWVIKLNADGSMQWQKTLGGFGGDNAYDIQQTPEGGYIVMGESYSSDGDATFNNGSLDYWIVKINSEGAVEWQKSFGGSDLDFGNRVSLTTDGGYIVCGTTGSFDGDVTGFHGFLDYWVVKLNSSGKVEWERALGGTDQEEARSIQQSADGGYIVAGLSGSKDGDVTDHEDSWQIFDYWLVKMDGSGNIQWKRSYGGLKDDAANGIEKTSDGGYVLTGYSYSNNGDVSGHHGSLTMCDYWVLKISSNAAVEWQKSLGGSGYDAGRSIQQTADGGYIVAGSSDSYDGDVTGVPGSSDNFWVVKLKPSGVLPLTLLSFTATAQQNKAVLLSWTTANETNNNFFTIEKSRDGNSFTIAGTIAAKADGSTQNNYTFTDNIPFTGTSYYRLKQTDKDGKFTYSKVVPVNIAALAAMLIKPNPSHNGRFSIDLGVERNNIRITATDNNGRTVYSKQLSSAQQLNIDLNKAKGIYFLQVEYDGGKDAGRLVIE